jgi:hypothetical protein
MYVQSSHGAWACMSIGTHDLIYQIFVASNQGDEDETRIDAIDVFGTPVE